MLSRRANVGPRHPTGKVAALRSTLSIRRAAGLLAIAVAAVGSLAILHLSDAATHPRAAATARAGSSATADAGLVAALVPRPADPDLFDRRRPDDPASRTTQLPIALLIAAGVVAGSASCRRPSPHTDASPRGPLLAVHGSRAPPVPSH